MSRLRLKSFKLLKAPQAAPVPPPLKKSVSTHVSIGKCAAQPHPPAAFSLKGKHCRSRGYLTRRQTDRSNITKDISKCSRSPVLAQPQGREPQKSRSPSYNEIKKKRLMRDRKSREKLLKPKDAQGLRAAPETALPQQEDSFIPNQQQLKLILRSKGLESESKIKGYIKQLQNVLCVLQEKQKPDGRSTLPQQSTPYNNLTDRKAYRPCQDSGKNTLRMYAQPATNSAETSRHQLVQQIIQKTKRQRKLINLKEVREQYKELSPAKEAFLTERVHTTSQQMQRKSIQPYQQVPEPQEDEREKENGGIAKANIHNETIPEESELAKTKRQALEDVSPQIKVECSEIKKRQRDSFFSDVPSYLKEAEAPVQLMKNSEGLLRLLDVDSVDLKRVFKSKEKKRLVEKWKKNFPEGFFEDIQLY